MKFRRLYLSLLFFTFSFAIQAQNRATLTNTVNSNIYANGAHAITGPILNSVLQNVINGEANLLTDSAQLGLWQFNSGVTYYYRKLVMHGPSFTQDTLYICSNPAGHTGAWSAADFTWVATRTSGLSGSGTVNYITKWSNSAGLGNSYLYQVNAYSPITLSTQPIIHYPASTVVENDNTGDTSLNIWNTGGWEAYHNGNYLFLNTSGIILSGQTSLQLSTGVGYGINMDGTNGIYAPNNGSMLFQDIISGGFNNFILNFNYSTYKNRLGINCSPTAPIDDSAGAGTIPMRIRDISMAPGKVFTCLDALGNGDWQNPAYTGTVTSVSAGNLSPLFTTSVSNPTTTPSISFSLSTVSANKFLGGNTSGSAAVPTYRSIYAVDLPATLDSAISLTTPGVIFSTPVTFTKSGHTASGTLSLISQSAYTILGNNTSSAATPTFFAPVLASALFQNQGTTTTVLHGNASGNPSWGAVSLTVDVSGTLPILNGGTGGTYISCDSIGSDSVSAYINGHSKLIENDTNYSSGSAGNNLAYGVVITASFNNIVDGEVVSILYNKKTSKNAQWTFPNTANISQASAATISGQKATFVGSTSSQFLVKIQRFGGRYIVSIIQTQT